MSNIDDYPISIVNKMYEHYKKFLKDRGGIDPSYPKEKITL